MRNRMQLRPLLVTMLSASGLTVALVGGSLAYLRTGVDAGGSILLDCGAELNWWVEAGTDRIIFEFHNKSSENLQCTRPLGGETLELQVHRAIAWDSACRSLMVRYALPWFVNLQPGGKERIAYELSELMSLSCVHKTGFVTYSVVYREGHTGGQRHDLGRVLVRCVKGGCELF